MMTSTLCAGNGLYCLNTHSFPICKNKQNVFELLTIFRSKLISFSRTLFCLHLNIRIECQPSELDCVERKILNLARNYYAHFIHNEAKAAVHVFELRKVCFELLKHITRGIANLREGAHFRFSHDFARDSF